VVEVEREEEERKLVRCGSRRGCSLLPPRRRRWRKVVEEVGDEVGFVLEEEEEEEEEEVGRDGELQVVGRFDAVVLVAGRVCRVLLC